MGSGQQCSLRFYPEGDLLKPTGTEVWAGYSGDRLWNVLGMLREWHCLTWAWQTIVLKGKHSGSRRLKAATLGEFQQPELAEVQGAVLSSSFLCPEYSRQIRQDQFPPTLHVSVPPDGQKAWVQVSKAHFTTKRP
jgi:hypothetical protein